MQILCVHAAMSAVHCHIVALWGSPVLPFVHGTCTGYSALLADVSGELVDG